MADKKMPKALVPLGSLQKERLEGGHRRSPWRHVLSPSRTWSLHRQVVCAWGGGAGSSLGGADAQRRNAGVAQGLRRLALPPCLRGAAQVASQPGLSGSRMLLEARLCPGYIA